MVLECMDGCNLGHAFICLSFSSPFLWVLLYIQKVAILTIVLYYKVLNLPEVSRHLKVLPFIFVDKKTIYNDSLIGTRVKATGLTRKIKQLQIGIAFISSSTS